MSHSHTKSRKTREIKAKRSAKFAREVKNKRPNLAERAREQAEQFSRDFPIGTEVLYYPTTCSSDPVRSRIRSKAWLLGMYDIVVLIEGRTGGVAVSHLEKVVEND